MSTQLTTTHQDNQLAQSFGRSPEDIAIMRESVLPDMSDAGIRYALQVFKHRGLDPFSGQVYAWEEGKDENRKVVICVSSGGLALMAERSGQYGGMEAPIYIDEDGNEHKYWLRKDPPAACKVVGYRKDGARFEAVAYWSERNKLDDIKHDWQRKKSPWFRMPAHMLAKVAKADFYRMAYPQQTSGLYEKDELPPREVEDTTYEPVLTEQQPAQKQIAPQPSPAKPEPAKPAPKPATDEQRMVLAELMNALGQDHPDYKAVMAVIPSTSKKVLTEDAARRGIKKYQDELEARRQGEKQMAAATQPLAETEAEKAVQTISAENAELEFDQNPY